MPSHIVSRSSMVLRAVLAAAAVLLPLLPPSAGAAPPPGDGAATVRAVRTTAPVAIDGREADSVWRTVSPTSGFRQYYPREDGAPTVETEFKVAYDDHNLYVFVRALDPHPDSIMHAVTRRDVNSASDVIGITIDGFHDRRTGVEFVLNPDGVKKDCAVYADSLFDWSWDGVWEGAARVDSAGWTAEFRIPFSQFRYADIRDHTFGFAVWRTSYRYVESSIWPLWRISRGGLISQLGQLVGVDDVASPHALAVTPYVVAKNVSRPGSGRYQRAQLGDVGGDVQYAIGPNLTLNATVNPDFGQVEADPSVLNLTTAETFFPEQRPFFLEGNRLYQFALGCTTVSCSNDGIFYSRRIGRAPQLSGLYGDASSPVATPIAGAAKLTGRTSSGLTIAMLDAVTERVGGVSNQTSEPRTNYAVVRAVQEMGGGRSAVGIMATGVDRALDASTRPLLHRSAYVGAVDFRQRLGRSPFELSGSLTGSRVAGSAAAITATQESPEHYFQRPDGSLHVDSTRTSLTGDAEEIAFSKYGGGAWHFQTAWQRHSAGLEVNDAGFLERSDLQTLTTGATVAARTPRWMFRLLQVTGNWSRQWTTSALPLDHTASLELYGLLRNNWSVDALAAVSQLPGTFCDHCARGGPAVRQDPRLSPAITISGDGRRTLIPSLSLSTTSTDDGRTRSTTVSPSVTVKLSSRAEATVGGAYTSNHDNTQWFGNFTDAAGATHYSFARLAQRTFTLTTRASFAATPTLTFDLYAAPFVTDGTYSDIRELSGTPRASSYDARFTPYVPPAGSAFGFDIQQLRSDVVARWEYKPGSTLFVVWTHDRDGSENPATALTLRDSYQNLFAAHPDNTFLIKWSYRIGR